MATQRRERSDDELLKLAVQHIESSEEHMRPILDRIKRARSVYKGTTGEHYGKPRNPSDPRDWRSRIYPPIVNEQIELLNAEMTVDDPTFSFTPRLMRFADDAKLAEKALDFFLDRARFSRRFRLAMRTVCKEGGQAIKLVFQREVVGFEERVVGIDPLGEEITEDEPIIEEALVPVLVRAEDLVVDPTANDFDDAAFAGHKLYLSSEDLEAKVDPVTGKPLYKNLHLLPESGGAKSDDERRDGETEEAFRARRMGMHEIIEMWYRGRRLTIANRSHVIYRNDNVDRKVGLPFVMIRIIDDEDCIFGVAVPTLIDDLQTAIWDALNDYRDAIKLSTRPPRLADIEEDPGAAEYSIHPDAVLPKGPAGSPTEIVQDVANLDKYNIVQLIEYLRALMERITGMNSQIAGVSEASTATEAAINIRQGKGRVGSELSVSDECWASFASKAYLIIQRNASQEVVAQLSNGEQVAFDPDDLTDMMITPKAAASERALKDLQRQDMQSVWMMILEAMNGPVAQILDLDPKAAFESLLESFGMPSDKIIRGYMQTPPMQPGAPPAEAPPAEGPPPMYLDESGQPVDPLSSPAEETPVGPRPENFVG